MSLSELFDFRIQRILWVTVIIALTNMFFHPFCVEGHNARTEFDEKGDVDTLLTNENNEEVVASASNIDRGYTYKYPVRFRLIDEIFKV